MGRNRDGLATLIREFSWPGGFPSHLAPIVPGTIHEGGELGYALATAFGAALDNPDLIVACIVGDGEAETGPTAGAWHCNKFLDPATCGAVLPMLHLNGYKIANPTIYKSMSDEELTKLFEGYGWHPLIVQGDDLDAALAEALDTAYGEIRELQESCPLRQPARAPALADARGQVAQGLDRPEGGRRHPGRGHLEGPPGAGDEGQVEPRAPRDPRGAGCARTGPEELFDENGGPVEALLDACPSGDLRMGANPHVNGGKLLKDAEAARARQARDRASRQARRDQRQRAGAARRVLRGRLPPERRRSATSGSCARTRWRRTASARCSRPPTTRGSGRSTP